MGGVRSITQRALNGLSGQRTVSIQEAVHMVDGQPLVLCSDYITYASLHRASMLKSENDNESTDIVTRYRNRPSEYSKLSMEQYFYRVFCKEKLNDTGVNEDRTKHRMLVPQGMKCRPKYPVDYNYARGMLLMHKPWSKDKPLTELLKDKDRTIRVFKIMVDRNKLPSSVIAQYISAMKYRNQAKLEIIAREGTQQPVDMSNLTDQQKDEFITYQHLSHFTDKNKFHREFLNGMKVDIGTDIDWTKSFFTEERDVDIDGEVWLNEIREEYYRVASAQASAKKNIIIPKQKNGEEYSVDSSEEQKQIVYKAIETVIKFLNNDPTYRPMRATIMGCGGTGKSFIINTIIAMIRKLTSCNDTVQVAAPSGAAAFNVQGSTIHRLLGIAVNHPHNNIPDKTRERLKKQLQRLLVLIIDERSMMSSKVLAAAERNTRQCIFNGQNSNELWGGLPVVLLFGDDYQLMPIADQGAIQSYAKKVGGFQHKHLADKMSKSQLLAFRGGLLFTEVMTENVYFLTKNYRVKCRKFRKLLERVRKGRPSDEDAERIMNLHLHHYDDHDKDFVTSIETHPKTMWLFTKNEDKDDKNVQKLIETSKTNNVPVARLDSFLGTNKQQGSLEKRCAIKSHFERDSYVTHTDICVGAKVAISRTNFLPEVGLYNGTNGTVKDIVYKTSTVGPNDKMHDHLPNYVVVDFPNIKLPPYIEPWDHKHPTVSTTFLMKQSYLSQTPSLLSLFDSQYYLITSTYPSQCTQFYVTGSVVQQNFAH